MDSTDGLKRGTEVKSMGSPIRMPKGEIALGRLLNVVGDAVDGLEQLPKEGFRITSYNVCYTKLLRPYY